MAKVEANCGSCRFFRASTCRRRTPVVLPDTYGSQPYPPSNFNGSMTPAGTGFSLNLTANGGGGGVIATTFRTKWPEVHAHDFCGEHEFASVAVVDKTAKRTLDLGEVRVDELA